METAKGSRPRPGRVMALCKELGWDREEKRTKRNRRSFLAKATLKFRAEFCPIEGRFPLDHTDPIAQECAKQFCALDERNPHFEDRFFDKTPEAIEQGLPSLPDDRELIIDRLAQLFCVQEYSSRKYKLRQREQLHNGDDEYMDEVEDAATSQYLSPYTTHIFRLDNDWTNHTRLSTTDCVAPAHIETPGIMHPENESSDTYRVPDQSSLDLNSIIVDFSSETAVRRNRQTKPETRSFSDKINQGQGSRITMPPRTNGAEHNYTPSEYNSQGRPNIEVAALNMQNSNKTKQPSLRQPPNVTIESGNREGPSTAQVHGTCTPNEGFVVPVLAHDRVHHNPSAKRQVSQTYQNHFQERLVGNGDAVSSLESSGISFDQESSTKRRRLDPIFQDLPSDESSVRERSTETTYGEGVSDGAGQKRQHAVQERQNVKRPREQLRQIEQANPKIRFVIENQEAMGKLDYYPEVPFPSHEVKDTTLAGFFELYSKHSDIDLAHLHMLVFKVCFSKDEVLKIRRWECEDSWKTVKGRLSYLFREARREKPTKYDFDVAVYANEPNIQVAQIEEDNYDGL